MRYSLIATLRHSLSSHKLSRDIAYTLASFVVLAVSGIVINVAVAGLRDAAALGVFNLSYAVYIAASQFAVFGIHYSVLRHAAFHEDSERVRGHLLCTASVCALVLGCLASGAVLLAEPLFARAFGSEVAGRAIRNSAWGLILFPLNKVLLAYLNGLRLMKAFALLQALRYFTVMALVTLVAASTWVIEAAAFCFIVAEALTAALAIAYLVSRGMARYLRVTSEWVRRHFQFGAKGLMAGMFAELNSRVDVLMIGFFLNERAVGIYSFAAMLVDGLYHVLAMIRINFNPMLVSALRDRNIEQARRLRTQSQRFVWPTILALSLVLIGTYWTFVSWIMPDKGLIDGLAALVVLVTGLALVSFLVPFDNLMMVSGHPGRQTLQQLASVGANVSLAAALLPVMGIEGAAISTVASYFTGTALLLFFAKRVVGWSLLTNRFR